MHHPLGPIERRGCDLDEASTRPLSDFDRATGFEMWMSRQKGFRMFDGTDALPPSNTPIFFRPSK
jgi:hypothetical protein